MAIAIPFIKQLALPSGKKGVVYIHTYAIGKVVSKALQCGFYKAQAEDKGVQLQAWIREGGWIVATRALGMGINIEGIVYVIHMDRLYGLTSFA